MNYKNRLISIDKSVWYQRLLISVVTLFALAGCGGGGGSPGTCTGICSDNTSSSSSSSSGSSSSSSSGSSTTSKAAVGVAIVDASTGQAVTSVTAGTPVSVKATVINTDGNPLSGAVVSFLTDEKVGSFDKSTAISTGAALTNASGVAIINLYALSSSTAGAATVKASAEISSKVVSGSVGYAIGAPNLTLETIQLGASTISAYGTTSVVTRVLSGNQPYTASQLTVNFSSPCAANSKATLSSSVQTVAGVATATYKDNGCGTTDVITASVSTISGSQSKTLTVTAPTVGSIQFVSAQPKLITLKGTGGTGLGETSTVTFKVVDQGGSPVNGQTVNFALNTSVGGVALTATTGITNTSGLVSTTVNSGTVPTPARVTATTSVNGQVLTTQSDGLTISTGIPSQAGFSLALSAHTIEGWNYVGTESTVTAQLVDRFGNPVPDNTVVNFVTEGGSIDSSCATSSGSCTVLFKSGSLQPTNGRVTILAYAIGEESFTDLDGDGYADKSPNELIDANGVSTDLPEAFVDYNENGIRDNNEPFIDFNANGNYDVADGKYNGVLCNESTFSSVGTCSATKSIHVRGMQTVIYSGSMPVVNVISTDKGGSRLDLAHCGSDAVVFSVFDVNGNPMPAGTTLKATLTNGKADGPVDMTITDSVTAINQLVDGVTRFRLPVLGDGSDSNGVCTDSTNLGSLQIEILTPTKKVKTPFRVIDIVN